VTLQNRLIEQIVGMTRERLHELVWTKPPAEVSAITGITRSSQRYHCERRQIQMPPRNHFRRRGTIPVPPLAPLVPKPKAAVVQREGNATVRLLSRELLYQAVWSEPMKRLAPRFKISDVGLAKRCRLLGVPIPPRGYWEKSVAGKAPERPPLPPAPADYEERVRLEREYRDEDSCRAERADDLLGKGPEFVQELMQRVSKPEIRRRYGISRHSLDRFCREHALIVPGRGFRHPERTLRQPSRDTGFAALAPAADVDSVAIVGEPEAGKTAIQPLPSPPPDNTGSIRPDVRNAPSERTVLPERLAFLGEDTVTDWLASFPNQASTSVRRSQL
jgi:hypothetical protein